MLAENGKRPANDAVKDNNSDLDGPDGKTTDLSVMSKSQIKQVIREILAEMLGVESGLNPRKMYPTSKAFTLLGYDRAEQLRDAVASGLLRLGKEVEDRRGPNAKIPRYYFDIDRCRKRLAELPQKRWTV